MYRLIRIYPDGHIIIGKIIYIFPILNILEKLISELEMSGTHKDIEFAIGVEIT